MKATLEWLFYGTPGEIRTPDPLVRSQVLYPAELRAQIFATNYKSNRYGFGKNLWIQ